MKKWNVILALGVVAIALAQQLWTVVQFQMPMQCSDGKESCIWFAQGFQHQMDAPLALLFTVTLTVILSVMVFRVSMVQHWTPRPVRIKTQRNLVRRE